MRTLDRQNRSPNAALMNRKKGKTNEAAATENELRRLVVTYQELAGEGLDALIVMAGLPGAVSATLNDLKAGSW